MWARCRVPHRAPLAGGTYENSTHRQEVFVVSEVKGAWQRAKEVPGTASFAGLHTERRWVRLH